MVKDKGPPPDQQKIDKFKETQLTKFQREYRILANGSATSKEEKNRKRYLLKNLEQIKKERTSVKTQLNVAMGITHVRLYDQNMKEVESHVTCQEALQHIINKTKSQILHIQTQNKRIDKETIKLNKTSLTEFQYNANLHNATKSLELVENKVDVSKRRECEMIAENSKLRQIINHMLFDRALFNKIWKKLVLKLANDKKFFIDLTERAVLAYNKGADLCAKLDALNENIQSDQRMQIREMTDMIRKLDADSKLETFLSVKGNYRELCELEDREIKRRNLFREYHNKKFTMYNNILERLKNFYEVNDVKMVLDKFTKYEDEFFSHFNYMNELNRNVEILNASVATYYQDIDGLTNYNQEKENSEIQRIKDLNDELNEEIAKTGEVVKKSEDYKSFIKDLLATVTQICLSLKCDDSHLKFLLGDHSQVTQFNLNKFLTMMEDRMNQVLSYVYYKERIDFEKRLNTIEDPEALAALLKEQKSKDLTIRGVERNKDDPTEITDIVIVQQCAECAEGEDVNRYDEEIVYPFETDDIKEKVRDKVKAPEIQYRLHSISKCRLPRSRNIVNKRYM